MKVHCFVRELLPWAMTLLLATVGCERPGGGQASGPSASQQRGALVTENDEPVWTQPRGWRVDVDPTIRIGAPGDAELFQRIVFATRLRDRTFVVIDGGDQTISRFDVDGSPLVRFGGEGDGPGEFRGVSWAGRIHGDSIAVHDIVLSRIQVFSAEGALGRSIALPGLTFVRGWFEDGTFLSSGRPAPRDPSAPEGVSESVWSVHSPDGSSHSVFATLPTGLGSSDAPVLFGPGLAADVGDSLFWYGFSDRYEITALDRAGRVRRVARRQVSLPQVPASVAERYRERSEETGTRDVAVAPTLPAFGGIEVARDGHVWVRRSRSGAELAMEVASAAPSERTDVWSVFDSDGVWLGDVETPDALEVLEIGDDYLLGIARDAFDVQSLQLHRIHR